MHSPGYQSIPNSNSKKSLFRKPRKIEETGNNNQKSFLALLLPPQCLFSLLVLTLLTPVVILSGVSLLEPLIDYALLFLPFAEHTQIAQFSAFPWIASIKLLLFIPLAGISYGLTLFKLTSLYHIAWTKQSASPHPNHCEFTPSPKASSFALLKWELYRWLKIAKMPVIFSFLTSLVLFAVLGLVQYFQRGIMIIFEVGFVLSFFALMTISFYLMLAVIQSIRSIFKTSLGSTAAILEPRQSARTLFIRAERLASYSPWCWLVLAQELVLYTSIAFTLWYMSSHFAVEQLYTLNFDLLKLYILGFVILVQYVVLLGCKFYAYTDALNQYYESVFGFGKQ